MFSHPKDGITIAMYVDDKEITDRDGNKMGYPLDNWGDANEIYYGLYLNVLAFLTRGKIDKLWLVARELNNKVFPQIYRPEIAEIVLEHYLVNYSRLPLAEPGTKKSPDKDQLTIFV